MTEPIRLMGITFPNRVGLAAGFDKQGDFAAWAHLLGFGHVELGTVTPKGQRGNEGKRFRILFRRKSIWNRMGFPNRGTKVLVSCVKARSSGLPFKIPIGVNIGPNRDTPLDDACLDYANALMDVFEVADYITLNVSSPNTEGLRELQTPPHLTAILNMVGQANKIMVEKTGQDRRPILVKISPDLSLEEASAMAEVLRSSEVDGIVACNSTGLGGFQQIDLPKNEGGLSGRLLTHRSLRVVEFFRNALSPRMVIIGCGGVMNAEDALAMREAGADLVQVYTGFLFGGPFFPRKIARALQEA